MNFELGKEYIVTVTDKGIIPVDEFNRERFYDKDNDDLDFLTDEEKVIIENQVYKKGLNDAWDYGKKIVLGWDDGGIACGELKEIFGTTNSYEIFEKYTIAKVIDKIKAYERKKDNGIFKVGDEIVFEKNGIFREGKVGVIYKVLYDSEDNIYYLIRFPDGTFTTHDGSNIKKTGKTYPYSPY